ncbi:MAG: hypothetical protein GX589_09350, partial [Deltaproteobacteria bacterium]|nr:hypothetical protein [Deltaproteobacteria bacterium]
TPVVFVTGMLALADKLLLSYGAADERVGLAWLNLPRLLERVRRYGPTGKEG